MSDLLSSGVQLPLGGATPLRGTDPAGEVSPERVRLLAQEFESLLLAQMLKEMRATLLGDDDPSTGFGGNPVADAAFTELSLALSRAGGIGIADTMLEPLTRVAEAAGEGRDEAGAPAAEHGAMPLARPDGPLPNRDGGPTLQVRPSGLTLAAAYGGPVTSEFGWRTHPIDGTRKFHAGTDIALPTGHPVPVARAGEVTFAGELPGYGRTVVVDHGSGLSTRYAHLSELIVREGDAVAAGQAIARSGASGRVTGPHLHFEVLMGEKAVDPEGFLHDSPSWEQP